MPSASQISLFNDSAVELVERQDEYTAAWHQGTTAVPTSLAALELAVAEQHLTNFELWNAEDCARAPGASNEDLARIKRFIDSTNQRRNDLTERLDALLLAFLAQRNLPKQNAELHSESPGLIIDRLSILSLKIFHTQQEIDRGTAGSRRDTARRNRQRLLILEEQRNTTWPAPWAGYGSGYSPGNGDSGSISNLRCTTILR